MFDPEPDAAQAFSHLSATARWLLPVSRLDQSLEACRGALEVWIAAAFLTLSVRKRDVTLERS
jgi:hypothetical protein